MHVVRKWCVQLWCNVSAAACCPYSGAFRPQPASVQGLWAALLWGWQGCVRKGWGWGFSTCFSSEGCKGGTEQPTASGLHERLSGCQVPSGWLLLHAACSRVSVWVLRAPNAESPGMRVAACSLLSTACAVTASWEAAVLLPWEGSDMYLIVMQEILICFSPIISAYNLFPIYYYKNANLL